MHIYLLWLVVLLSLFSTISTIPNDSPTEPRNKRELSDDADEIVEEIKTRSLSDDAKSSNDETKWKTLFLNSDLFKRRSEQNIDLAPRQLIMNSQPVEGFSNLIAKCLASMHPQDDFTKRSLLDDTKKQDKMFNNWVTNYLATEDLKVAKRNNFDSNTKHYNIQNNLDENVANWIKNMANEHKKIFEAAEKKHLQESQDNDLKTRSNIISNTDNILHDMVKNGVKFRKFNLENNEDYDLENRNLILPDMHNSEEPKTRVLNDPKPEDNNPFINSAWYKLLNVFPAKEVEVQKRFLEEDDGEEDDEIGNRNAEFEEDDEEEIGNRNAEFEEDDDDEEIGNRNADFDDLEDDDE